MPQNMIDVDKDNRLSMKWGTLVGIIFAAMSVTASVTTAINVWNTSAEKIEFMEETLHIEIDVVKTRVEEVNGRIDRKHDQNKERIDKIEQTLDEFKIWHSQE